MFIAYLAPCSACTNLAKWKWINVITAGDSGNLCGFFILALPELIESRENMCQCANALTESRVLSQCQTYRGWGSTEAGGCSASPLSSHRSYRRILRGECVCTNGSSLGEPERRIAEDPEAKTIDNQCFPQICRDEVSLGTGLVKTGVSHFSPIQSGWEGWLISGLTFQRFVFHL